MAYMAACTNAGVRKQVNEDACCLEVALTPFGEVLMAVVCDGVGGLSRGDVASSTVINRFVMWFERELPMLVEGMVAGGQFDFALIRVVWDALLRGQNELIRAHGAKLGVRLGTTFTGIIACNGYYLIAHVGDCRVYRMNARSFEQLTQDQTQVAKRLAAGEITEEEARRQPKNVILQAVGSQRTLKPEFYEGGYSADDLFVICCDGAYHQAENEGIRNLFQNLDYRDEAALQEACDTLLQFDMDCGEKDNLTVACFSGALAGPEEDVMTSQPATHVAGMADIEDDALTMVAPDVVGDEDDLPTMVEAEEDSGEAEDDVVTMVADDTDEDDLATMVGSDDDTDEDDLATMVESDDDSAEDDLATMVGSDDDTDEDDLATMVASDDDTDEDDLATMVADEQPSTQQDVAIDRVALLRQLAELLSSSDEDDAGTIVFSDDGDDEDEDDDFGLPTFGDEGDEDDLNDGEPLWADDLEDDAPTMVADDDDDLPTMVEGADA